MNIDGSSVVLNALSGDLLTISIFAYRILSSLRRALKLDPTSPRSNVGFYLKCIDSFIHKFEKALKNGPQKPTIVAETRSSNNFFQNSDHLSISGGTFTATADPETRAGCRGWDANSTPLKHSLTTSNNLFPNSNNVAIFGGNFIAAASISDSDTNASTKKILRMQYLTFSVLF